MIPYGYTFTLDKHEVAYLRSQNVTATPESDENQQVKLSHRNQHNPVAFTEKGLYILATILKSKQAVATYKTRQEQLKELLPDEDKLKELL